MNTQVSKALQRLDSLLPLLAGLKSLSDDEAALYCKLLNSYVQQGRILNRDEAAETDSVCADSLCMEMLFLANDTVARTWLTESADNREIFDLASAVDFAAGFFVPLTRHCRQLS